MIASAAVVVVVALAGPLMAGDVDALLTQARARYDAVAYDEALAMLDAALAPSSSGPPLEGGERARVLAFLGVVRAQMADDAGAAAAFDDAAALDACVAFPDAAATPRIRALFDERKGARMAALTAASAVAASTTAPPAPVPTPPRPDDVGWALPAGVAVAAAGVTSLAAGAVVGGMAIALRADADAALVQTEAVALEASAREQALVANALAALGTVLVVSGAVAAGVGVVVDGL